MSDLATSPVGSGPSVLSADSPDDRALLRELARSHRPRWGGFTDERKTTVIDRLFELAGAADVEVAADAIKTLAFLERMNQVDDHFADKKRMFLLKLAKMHPEPRPMPQFNQQVNFYAGLPTEQQAEVRKLQELIE